MMKKKTRPLLLLLAAATLLSACVTEDVADNTKRGNFETLWSLIDRHYCFFDYKEKTYGLDWDKIHLRYSAAVSEGMTHEQLFEVLSKMTYELRDGHVNLMAAHDVARYGAWFDDYPLNFSDSLQRIYLGRTTDFKQSSGLRYRTLDDNIGYVRCPSFANEIGGGNLEKMMEYVAPCDGLIIDVRNNSGGLLTAAEKLASIFVNEETTVGYMQHKTGPGHNDFSKPEAIRLKPFVGLRWQKPVCILANRQTYSAANSFVMYVKDLPNVTVVGDRTGGGAGLPFSSELPNGWGVRFSACPMFDAKMQQTELGIDPDVKVDITADDYSRSVDTIIETARQLLNKIKTGK